MARSYQRTSRTLAQVSVLHYLALPSALSRRNRFARSLAVLLVRNRLCLFDNGWLDLNGDARPLERPRVDQPLAKGLRLLG
jgi:hypothetical protein